MNVPTPPPAQRATLCATCSTRATPGGEATTRVIRMTVAKLPNGRIKFTPHLTGVPFVFALDEDDLLKCLVRWVY